MSDDPPVRGSQASRIDLRRALAVALSIGGYLAALAAYLVISEGQPLAPGGDLLAYLRAASDLLAGREVYVGQIGDAAAFAYAPTWAIGNARP